jgi:hypothetical protein
MAQVVNVDADGLVKAAATVAEHLAGAATPPAGALPPQLHGRRPTWRPPAR